MAMTWDQFKKAVDDRLREKGKDGDITIWYIDVHSPNVVRDGDYTFDVIITDVNDLVVA